MPLTWDATEVAAWDTIEPALKNSVDFMMMSTGVNHITESNVEDFWRRTNLLEKGTGAFRTGYDDEKDDRVEVYLTPDEARSLIGYRTNVSPMTKAKFKGHLFSIHERLVSF